MEGYNYKKEKKWWKREKNNFYEHSEELTHNSMGGVIQHYGESPHNINIIITDMKENFRLRRSHTLGNKKLSK